MKRQHPPPTLDPSRLLEVIRIQTDIIKQGLDLAAVILLVARQAQQLTRAVGAVVELVDGEEMVYRATTGMAESFLGMRLRRDGSLSGRCIEEGSPLYCRDSEVDERVDREACRRVGLRSMIVEPLRHHDTPVGVLKVLSREPNAFDEADMRILQLLAEPIAAAMFLAARYEASDLFYRATHDGLTGLSNRASFYDRLRQRFVQAEEDGGAFSILSFDMDGLKAINDGLGHRAGDAAIREFAERLRAAATPEDVIARMGGDEFSILLARGDTREKTLLHVEHFTGQIGGAFAYGTQQLPVNASCGWALFPNDGTDVEGLLEAADQQMYVQKRHRKAAIYAG